jgi:hypothetical protein
MSQEPPPLPPLPVLALPETPGAYTSDYLLVQPRRPGIITAVGVISIVVASLGLLAFIQGGVSLVQFRVMANYGQLFLPPATIATQAATPATAPTAAQTTAAVSPRGLDAVARAEVAGGLAELHFISGPRLEQLDALLATAGRDMFPVTPGQTLDADYAGALVEFHTTGITANPDTPGPDMFRTRGGRFELYDDRAVFYPPKAEIVRVSALTRSSSGLSTAQVETVVSQAQSAAGNTINPSQVAALRTLLSAPGQQFVSPIMIPTAVRSAKLNEDGSVVLEFPNGYASIGPQGQTTSGVGPGAAAAAAALAGGRSAAGINGTAMALAVFALFVGLGLAIFLLVSGILTLRNSRHGRRLHLIYAGLKVPVTVLGFVGTWWLTSSYLDGMYAAAADPARAVVVPKVAGLGIGAAITAALGLIYPIALLIVLQTRTVKSYYAD